MQNIDTEALKAENDCFEQHLNPRFTFEEFVNGTSNQFPFAAARAVGEWPGTDYNPLFLCSEWPVGKTHLLHAIGNKIRSNSPQSRVLLTSRQSFSGELRYAIRINDLTEMRNRYLEVDTLLLDDLTFIAGEEFVVEAFFLLVCDLVSRGKQVVATSSAISTLKIFVDHLRMRCANSLIADFDPLDIESKMAILKSDAVEFGIRFPDDLSLYLAKSINRRCDLIGCVKWLIVRCLFNDKKISLSLGKQYVGSVCNKARRDFEQ